MSLSSSFFFFFPSFSLLCWSRCQQRQNCLHSVPLSSSCCEDDLDEDIQRASVETHSDSSLADDSVDIFLEVRLILAWFNLWISKYFWTVKGCLTPRSSVSLDMLSSLKLAKSNFISFAGPWLDSPPAKNNYLARAMTSSLTAEAFMSILLVPPPLLKRFAAT